MKRLCVFFVFFSFIIVFQSCFTKHYEITDIEFNAAAIDLDEQSRGHLRYVCTSIIKYKLIFAISNKEDFVAQNILKSTGGVCYATTPGRVVDNSLLEKSFSLKLNKPFLYKGKEISAGVDIFSINEIYKEIRIFERKTFCDKVADKILDFSDYFSENSVFQKEEYEVLFSCKTSDNKEFFKTITILFE